MISSVTISIFFRFIISLSIVFLYIQELYNCTDCLFLLFFGACSILLESLRYDRFLSISFVGLEHILSAFFLLAGILILARRIWHTHRKLAVWSIISVFAAAGIALALEFALDRSTMNKILIYGIYVIVLSIPVALGIRMRRIGTGTAA